MNVSVAVFWQRRRKEFALSNVLDRGDVRATRDGAQDTEVFPDGLLFRV